MNTQVGSCTLDARCPKCKTFCGLRKDRELVKQIQRGNDGAFTSLVEQYTPMLKKFFRNKRIPDDHAEDLINEVYIVVIQDILEFVWMGKPVEWWLRSIAKRIARAWIRREHHYSSHTILLDERGLNAGDGAALCETVDFSTEFSLEQAAVLYRQPDKDVVIYQAIQQLPKIQGDIISLIYFEEITSSQEVADRLNLTHNTPGKISAGYVRANHKRALKKLQQILSQEFYLNNRNATRAQP